MTIEILVELVNIADIAELKTLSSSGSGKTKRIDKDLRVVRDVNTYKNIAYQYFESLDYAEALPAIIKPTDNLGCWLMIGNPFIASTSVPSNPPDIAKCDYIATLAAPDRILRYRSYSLSDPPAVTDWAIIKDIHNIDAAPTFLPDYQGQQVRDFTTNTIYIGDGITASADSWLPASMIKGTAIVASKTISLGDRNRWFNISDNLTITLPGNINKAVNIDFVIDVAGKTATLTPDSGTGAVLIGSPTITDSAKIRSNGNIWYRF